MEDVFSEMEGNLDHADITDATTQNEGFDPLEAGLLVGLGAHLADEEKELFIEEDEDILAEITKEERLEKIRNSAERVSLKKRNEIAEVPLPEFERFVMAACKK